jgi:transforming growth factor-beta-induced protein
MSSDLSQDQVVGMANGGNATITSLDPPMINDATITLADVGASNGVVHVVDSVLLPTSVTSNIVDIATSPAGAAFSTLVSAVTAAELVETLGGEGPFTVFAPTDDAFAAVDPAVLEYLLTPEGKEDLVNVLTYHVFPGVVYQSDVADGSITMVNGDSAAVTASPLTIEGANIVEGKILASNGVIHAIDAVILPPSLVLPDLSAGETEEMPEDMPADGAVSIRSVAALVSAAVAVMLF